MRTALLSVAAAIGLGPAAAGASPFCDLLWVTRNAIFDRAGYCFASPLGRALFDNADCTQTRPVVPAADAPSVARMTALEARAGCRVDTRGPPTSGQRAILARLARFADLPEPEERGWACIGYLGAPFDLRAGATTASATVGRVVPGQSLVFNYRARDGWHYIIATGGPDGGTYEEGWGQADIARGLCRGEAG
ncbi:MAG: DUF4453 domain-containing protein [Rhodobacteraceae bacterium]|jgi:hypothetical protein|nr:DUF4453 domain-containing protein [Paracoccaceae bacterium]